MKHGNYKSRKTMKRATRRHSRPAFAAAQFRTSSRQVVPQPRGLLDQVAMMAATMMAAFRRKGRR